jgi:hypothetical protein
VSGLSYSLDPDNRVALQTPNMAGFRMMELEKAVHELSTRVPTAAADKLKVLATSQQELERNIEEVKIAHAPLQTRPGTVKVEQLPATSKACAPKARQDDNDAAGAIRRPADRLSRRNGPLPI